MDRKRRSLGFVTLVILLGAIVGTLLGHLLGMILPDDSVVEEFFLKSGDLALGPGTLNAGIFKLTLGFELHINVVGLIGVIVAVYLLRWY
jgi:hypothetical protein